MSAHDISGLLHHRLIPALPVPFTSERIIHHDSHVRLADYMSDMPIAGVAVWAHTGRGLLLTEEEREEVLMHWRESLPNAVLIAGAGCPASNGGTVGSDDEYMDHTRMMAEHAKSLGADTILCHPPTRFRELPENERDDAVIEYHHELSRVGLPMVLFYLYEAAGGIQYSARVLRELFALPNVLGIKIATLDSVMTFQALARAIKTEFPDKLLITGEDRFLGYSLMMGADAALVGMGAALTSMHAEMMQAFYEQKFGTFEYRSKFVDRFAMATFTHPMEGYISRMLYALSWLDVVSPEAIFDPWGPGLPEEEIEKVGDFLAALPTELKR